METVMKQACWLSFAISVASAIPAMAQSADPDPAMNNPDLVSWQLFVQVAAPGGFPGKSDVVFETWASNRNTFNANPTFPAGPTPKILEIPTLAQLAPRRPGLLPHILPGGRQETRRNKTTFDFIVREENRFHTRAGLARAFAAGKVISFPIDSIEVKADWVPANTVADPTRYHVNTADGQQQFALVSFHIISKMVPNWTWATFEHENNLGRCDHIGCHDEFGAVVAHVSANTLLGQSYGTCAKTPAVQKMMSDAKLADVFSHYCLKGSQTDFTTATGLPKLLGNSVTEGGFDNTSSCLSCHSRASVAASGADAQGGGFLDPPDTSNPLLCPTGDPCSPSGTPRSSWFWNNPGTPNQQLKALQTDFIWSIPIFAIGP
jgi:hypothetical protein